MTSQCEEVRAHSASGGGSRTPLARARAGTMRSLPWGPAVLLVAAVGVIGLAAYLVVQSGRLGRDRFAAAVRAEADADPALPGQFIDLQGIYGSPYPGDAPHVRAAVDYAAAGNSNPPVGGPLWGSTVCPNDPTAAPLYCGPAPWGIYREPWRAEVLVHNMERGGVVIWYRTADLAARDDLEAIVRDQLESGKYIVLAPYPDMENESIALTAWSRIDKFPAGDLNKDRVVRFIQAHERRFNPENY